MGWGTYRGGFDDGDSFDDFTFVHFGARSVEVADNGGHAGFVSEGGGEVDGVLRVVLGEGLVGC